MRTCRGQGEDGHFMPGGGGGNVIGEFLVEREKGKELRSLWGAEGQEGGYRS